MNNIPITPTQHVTLHAVNKPHERQAVRILDEFLDRERRKSNFIIHNILESTRPDSAKCNQDDHYKVLDLIKEGLKFYDIDESRFEKQIRLGCNGQNREGKHRLILITFTTTQLKWDILKQAKLPRNAERWRTYSYTQT